MNVYRNHATGGLFVIIATGYMETTMARYIVYEPLADRRQVGDDTGHLIKPASDFFERFALVPHSELAPSRPPSSGAPS